MLTSRPCCHASTATIGFWRDSRTGVATNQPRNSRTANKKLPAHPVMTKPKECKKACGGKVKEENTRRKTESSAITTTTTTTTTAAAKKTSNAFQPTHAHNRIDRQLQKRGKTRQDKNTNDNDGIATYPKNTPLR